MLNLTAATLPAFVPVPAMLAGNAGMMMGWQAVYAEAYRRAAEQVRAREEARHHTLHWDGREIVVRFATSHNSANA